MALFYKCGFRKAIAGFTVLIAIAIIVYISTVFFFSYLPSEYPDLCFTKIFI
jgi:hypothetical protein